MISNRLFNKLSVKEKHIKEKYRINRVKSTSLVPVLNLKEIEEKNSKKAFFGICTDRKTSFL